MILDLENGVCGKTNTPTRNAAALGSYICLSPDIYAYEETVDSPIAAFNC